MTSQRELKSDQALLKIIKRDPLHGGTKKHISIPDASLTSIMCPALYNEATNEQMNYLYKKIMKLTINHTLSIKTTQQISDLWSEYDQVDAIMPINDREAVKMYKHFIANTTDLIYDIVQILQ